MQQCPAHDDLIRKVDSLCADMSVIKSYFSLGGVIMRSALPMIWAALGAGVAVLLKG